MTDSLLETNLVPNSPGPDKSGNHQEKVEEAATTNMSATVSDDTANAPLPVAIREIAEDVDISPFREVRGLNGMKLWIRTIDHPSVEVMTAEGAQNVYRLVSKAKTERKPMDIDSGSLPIQRPGNRVGRFSYKALMPEEQGEDRWSADLLTWQAIRNLVERYPPFDQDQNLVTGDEEEIQDLFWTAWFKARKEQGLTDNICDKVKKGEGSDDLMFFSVFDGHTGKGTAQALKVTLHGCLAYAIGQARIKSEDELMFPERVIQIIKDTFKAVDDDFTQSPLKLIGKNMNWMPNETLPPQLPSQLCGQDMLPSGSCALNVMYDASTQRVYIANCGDCRAVAGWWNAKEKKWRCDVLTEDQNGDNPKERERIESEHPGSERGHIMKANPEMRIFGKLHPTRVFGDHVYKWKYEDFVQYYHSIKQEKPYWTYKKEDLRIWKTPPYATAEPQVTWRDLRANEDEELKFIILATDGLWGRLTSEEAFLLTATTYDDSKFNDSENLDKKEIIERFFPTLEDFEEGHPFPNEQMDKEGQWDFRDEIVPKKLIRNAYGGNDPPLRRQMLSISPEYKGMRDDITALVVHFDEPDLVEN